MNHVRRFALASVAGSFCLASFAWGDAAAGAQKDSPSRLKLAPGQTAIYVANMHCGSCAKKIARKLYALKGVLKVGTNVKQDLAIVTPQKRKAIEAKAIWSAVQSAGFEPVKLIGPDGVYTANKKTKAPEKVADAPQPTRRG